MLRCACIVDNQERGACGLPTASGFWHCLAVVCISVTPVPASDLCPATGAAPTKRFCVTRQQPARGEFPVTGLASVHATPADFLRSGMELTIGLNDIPVVSQQQEERIALHYSITQDPFLQRNVHPPAPPRAAGAVLAVFNANYLLSPQTTASKRTLIWIVDIYARDVFYVPAGNIGGYSEIFSNTLVWVDATNGQIVSATGG